MKLQWGAFASIFIATLLRSESTYGSINSRQWNVAEHERVRLSVHPSFGLTGEQSFLGRVGKATLETRHREKDFQLVASHFWHIAKDRIAHFIPHVESKRRSLDYCSHNSCIAGAPKIVPRFFWLPRMVLHIWSSNASSSVTSSDHPLFHLASKQ
jgi:hypothetical protein